MQNCDICKTSWNEQQEAKQNYTEIIQIFIDMNIPEEIGKLIYQKSHNYHRCYDCNEYNICSMHIMVAKRNHFIYVPFSCRGQGLVCNSCYNNELSSMNMYY